MQVTSYKPVIITSNRTLTLERSRAQELKKEVGAENGILLPWMAMTMMKQAEILPLAISVVRGEFDPDQVEENEQEFRIHDPFLYVALRQEMVLDEAWRDRARLTLASDLTALGHRVAMLSPDPEVFEFADPDILNKVKRAGVEERDIIPLSRHNLHEAAGTMAFPRDMFTQIGGTIYVCPGEHNPYNLENLFNWARGLDRNYSRIGMGGEVIIADHFALLSDQVKPDETLLDDDLGSMSKLLEMVTIGETEATLTRMGKQVHRVPTGWMELFPRDVLEEIGARKPVLIPADHADLQVMYLPAERGLFFSERYYQDNRDSLDRIVEQIKPNLVATLPDEDGLPINSLPLPGGGVYMDAAAIGSANILRKLGIKVETTSVPYGTWAWGTNAGIHCSTNLINLPDV